MTVLPARQEMLGTLRWGVKGKWMMAVKAVADTLQESSHGFDFISDRQVRELIVKMESWLPVVLPCQTIPDGPESRFYSPFYNGKTGGTGTVRSDGHRTATSYLGDVPRAV